MTVSVKLDAETDDRMRILAEALRRLQNHPMRKAIDQYLVREGTSKSFKQEALASWTEFQVTGLHLTGEEASAWLKTWGTKDERSAGPCHD